MGSLPTPRSVAHRSLDLFEDCLRVLGSGLRVHRSLDLFEGLRFKRLGALKGVLREVVGCGCDLHPAVSANPI